MKPLKSRIQHAHNAGTKRFLFSYSFLLWLSASVSMGISFLLCVFSAALYSKSFHCFVSLACRAYRISLLYSGVCLYEICRNLRDLYHAEVTHACSEVTGGRDISKKTSKKLRSRANSKDCFISMASQVKQNKKQLLLFFCLVSASPLEELFKCFHPPLVSSSETQYLASVALRELAGIDCLCRSSGWQWLNGEVASSKGILFLTHQQVKARAVQLRKP